MKKITLVVLVAFIFTFIIVAFPVTAKNSNGKIVNIKDFLSVSENKDFDHIVIHTFKNSKLLSATITEPSKIKQFANVFLNYRLVACKSNTYDWNKGWYIEFYDRNLKFNNFCYICNNGIDKYCIVMNRLPIFNYKVIDYKKLDSMLNGYIKNESSKITDDNKQITDSKSDFAINLINNIENDKNYLLSPLSIKMALAMAANGSSGKTKAEILKTLGIEDIQSFNDEAKSLIETLNSDKNIKFDIANSIWLNTDYANGSNIDFNSKYKQLIANYYKGTASEVNKRNAVNLINSWISKKTENRINNCIGDSSFLAALVNTIYFKGSWAQSFEKGMTSKKEFTCKDGKKYSIDFMNRTDDFNYYEDNNLQSISIPYVNPDISMYIVLPKAREYTYSSKDMDNIINNHKTDRVQISMPKFKVEYNIDLSDAMKKMGINTAFTENAEINNTMFENCKNKVSISNICHKTYISIDENGTEAAAATVLTVNATCAKIIEDKPKQFNADHPFLYFIRDNKSGEILFIGQLNYAH